MNDELPERRWDLSAPESQVLLWGPETSDAWALKPALLELVVRRVLRLCSMEERRLFLFPRATNVLSRGPGEIPAGSRSLGVVIENTPASLRAYAGGLSGVPVERLAHEVFARYLRRVRVRTGVFRWQRTGDGYVQSEVLPELERRGLYERGVNGRVGIESWELTPAGVEALEEIRTLMAIGRGAFGKWVEHDPDRAARYVATAGPSLLLLGGVTPAIQRLAQRSANGGSDGRMGVDADDAFGVRALAEAFGPAPFDGLEAAACALAEGVDRAWDELHRRCGGLVLGAGE